MIKQMQVVLKNNNLALSSCNFSAKKSYYISIRRVWLIDLANNPSSKKEIFLAFVVFSRINEQPNKKRSSEGKRPYSILEETQ